MDQQEIPMIVDSPLYVVPFHHIWTFIFIDLYTGHMSLYLLYIYVTVHILFHFFYCDIIVDNYILGIYLFIALHSPSFF